MKVEPKLIDVAAIRSLPRSTTPWQMSLRDAPRAADPAGLYRLLIIVSAGANTIRLMEATTEQYLPAEALADALERAMTQAHGRQVPARPPAVVVDCPELAASIEPPMRSCGVEVRVEQQLAAIDPVIEALEERPGLFSHHSLLGSRAAERALATAAADLAAEEPWRYFADECPLAFHSGDGPPRIVVVLGVRGECLGAACYANETSFHRGAEHAARGRVPGEPIPFDGWSLTFANACATPQAVRQAFARHGLSVAHALYPHFNLLRNGEPPLEIESEGDAHTICQHLVALTQLIKTHGAALIDGRWTRSRHKLQSGETFEIRARPDLMADTSSGLDADAGPFSEADGLVESDIDETLTRLLPADHLMLVMGVPHRFIQRVAPDVASAYPEERDVPSLVIRATRRDARRVLNVLEELHALAFARRSPRSAASAGHEERELEVIYGLSIGGLAGVLSIFGATHDQPTLNEELKGASGGEAERVAVVVVGGGTRRPLANLRAGDVVGAVQLRVLDWDS